MDERSRLFDRGRSVAGALGWTGLAQALSSISNLLFSAVAGRAGGSVGLGRFAIVLAAYVIALGFLRELLTEPYLTDKGEERSEEAFTAAAAYGIVVALVLGAVGAMLGQTSLLAGAVVLPVLLTQDALRFVAFRRGRPRVAAELDALWVAAGLVAFGLAATLSSTGTIYLWGVGAAVGVAWGSYRLRIGRTRLTLASSWASGQIREVGGHFVGAGLLYTAGTHGLLLVFAALLGESALGMIRAAQVLFGPIGLIVTGLGFYWLPRLPRRGPGLWEQAAMQVPAVTSGIALCLAPFLFVFRDPILDVLFDGALTIPTVIAGAIGGQTVLVAAWSGVMFILRSARAGRAVLRSSLFGFGIGTPIALALATRGLAPAVWGLVIQNLAMLLACWLTWFNRGRKLAMRPR